MPVKQLRQQMLVNWNASLFKGGKLAGVVINPSDRMPKFRKAGSRHQANIAGADN
jgi:hypothetical protein